MFLQIGLVADDGVKKPARTLLPMIIGLLMVGCGGASAGSAQRTTADPAAIDLALVTATGDTILLREYRGAPLLLYLFTTYDIGSQAALVPLEEVLARHPEVQALGIAVQPDPEGLLPYFAQSLEVSFPLSYDPRSRVVRGESPLGEVPAVPLFIHIDAHGRLRGRYLGVPTVDELESLLRR